MRTLSVLDAQDYFFKLNPEYYIFSTENQKKYFCPNCLTAVVRYTEVLFSKFTNRVCFKNGNNTLCFSDVKCIKIDETPSIGTPFYVVCENKDKKTGETVFAFIAD